MAVNQTSIEANQVKNFAAYPSPTSFGWIIQRMFKDILQKPLTFVLLVWLSMFAIAAFCFAFLD